MNINSFFVRARNGQGLNSFVWLTMGVGTVFSIIGVFVDARTLLGVPIWLKPTKFFISFLIYCPTIAWMLSYAEASPKLVRNIGSVIGVSSVYEVLAIAGQAFRGTRSHGHTISPVHPDSGRPPISGLRRIGPGRFPLAIGPGRASGSGTMGSRSSGWRWKPPISRGTSGT